VARRTFRDCPVARSGQTRSAAPQRQAAGTYSAGRAPKLTHGRRAQQRAHEEEEEEASAAQSIKSTPHLTSPRSLPLFAGPPLRILACSPEAPRFMLDATFDQKWHTHDTVSCRRHSFSSDGPHVAICTLSSGLKDTPAHLHTREKKNRQNAKRKRNMTCP